MDPPPLLLADTQQLLAQTEGNHEIEVVPIIHSQAFTACNTRWRMPFEESGSKSNLCYLFDVTSVHAGSDLAKVDKRVTPWIMVCLHAPWYNTNTAHLGEGENMRKASDGGVATRVYNNKAEQCGPVQVTIGDGGNREGLALTFKKPSSPLSLFREAGFGHDRLRVYNRTHAHWSWYRNDDTDSTVGDQVWLENLAASSRCGVSVHSRSGDDEL
uniref:Purple acid phosphatase C-terminal domain-containing protein n=1 Tax=Nelumbo nucifera TaxID=4432 RepID=A0A822YH02_NELNU|nr:TPA_asm: hypothetical protein HUJ06_009400 [Nelumbo nucifera]